MWIDTHCHLDAAEFDADRDAVVERARAAGVTRLVLPAVAVADFERVRALARAHDAVYALGIHPLALERADEADLGRLRAALAAHRDDPRLVAVGEIGLDHFVAGADRERQARFCAAQLALAREAGLPVLLHSRRAVDPLARLLREARVAGGIAHAFNGSAQQARVYLDLGFALGFGGTLTFERSLNIRRLAQSLPEHALVLETDAPDIPPQWLYRRARERHAAPGARNEPAELPRIAATLAELRGWTLEETAERTARNAGSVLPRLAALGAA